MPLSPHLQNRDNKSSLHRGVVKTDTWKSMKHSKPTEPSDTAKPTKQLIILPSVKDLNSMQ